MKAWRGWQEGREEVFLDRGSVELEEKQFRCSSGWKLEKNWERDGTGGGVLNQILSSMVAQKSYSLCWHVQIKQDLALAYL